MVAVDVGNRRSNGDRRLDTDRVSLNERRVGDADLAVTVDVAEYSTFCFDGNGHHHRHTE
jgi:hypothetical protein